MPMRDTRKLRLQHLIDTRFGRNQQRFAAAAKMSKGRVSQLLRPDSPFGETAAENIRAKLRLPERYFETPLDDSGTDRVKTTAFDHLVKVVPAPFEAVQSIPVLTRDDLSLMELLNDDPLLAPFPRIAAVVESGPRLKAVEVFDDSMTPVMRQGDLVHLDPDLQPQAGDKVLVQDKAGAYHLREFRVRSGGTFEAAALNPVHQTLHSEIDGLRIVAVATHLTQSLRKSLLGRAAIGLAGTFGFLLLGTALSMADMGPETASARLERPIFTRVARSKPRHDPGRSLTM